MIKSYGRRAKLRFKDKIIKYPDLELEFTINFDTTSEGNVGHIRLFNLADKTKKVRELMNEDGYDYPRLLDHNKEIGSRYRVSAIPTSYFLGPQGKIKYIKRGLITAQQLQEIKDKIMEVK